MSGLLATQFSLSSICQLCPFLDKRDFATINHASSLGYHKVFRVAFENCEKRMEIVEWKGQTLVTGHRRDT